MQDYLILKLEGVMQSWGTHTYEDYRPSNLFPTLSGILGLLGACLGIERGDRERLQALDRSFELAVRADRIVFENGRRLQPVKLADFHTVLDARKVGGKINKYPVVSHREYLCDAKFTLAVRAAAGALITLDELEGAVKRPRYTPFLGRRSCPLTRPLWEQRLAADSFEAALAQIAPRRGVIYSEWIERQHSRLQLRDVPLRDAKRQFATRFVHIQAHAEGPPDVSQ